MTEALTALIERHQSYDAQCFTWSCHCGVDFHDAPSHAAHVANVISGVYPGVSP